MRRILTDIKLDKIAAVTEPAQEGALAIIMKRRDSARPAQPKSAFDQAVETIAKQEGISKTEAMAKVRRTQPAMFDEFQKAAPPRGNSRFEKLVQEDIQRGCTREIAMQRAIQKGAARIAPNGEVEDTWSGTGDATDANAATDEFENLVHQMMISQGIKRTNAYQRVARQRPDLLQKMR